MTFTTLGNAADQTLGSPLFWLLVLIAIIGVIVQESWFTGSDK